jgi:hypothetical protein
MTGSYAFVVIFSFPAISAVDSNDPICDRSKPRCIFDGLNDVYSKYYVSSEYLTVDEVVICFKGRLNFKQLIPKKHKRVGITTYELCDMSCYTYDMDMSL